MKFIFKVPLPTTQCKCCVFVFISPVYFLLLKALIYRKHWNKSLCVNFLSTTIIISISLAMAMIQPVLCIITFGTTHTSLTYVTRFPLPIPDLRYVCFFLLFCSFHFDPLPFERVHRATFDETVAVWSCSLLFDPSLTFFLLLVYLCCPLFSNRIFLRKKSFFSSIFFFIQSDTFTAFLPDSILLSPFPAALIFSPACIHRKRRRSHSSAHDWPQPVSQTFLRGGRRQRGRGCCRHNRGIHQPTICGQGARWFLPNSVLRLTALLAGPEFGSRRASFTFNGILEKLRGALWTEGKTLQLESASVSSLTRSVWILCGAPHFFAVALRRVDYW